MKRTNIKSMEAVLPALQTLYEGYGYTQYKMSKFEEYDLYVRNKDFLISDSVITFTDTNGKLMALKPDVTLSIIKNSRDLSGDVQKVYYNENVYRISKGTHTFKEILQMGLECMGDIDAYSLYEVIALACKSLRAVSEAAVLDLSHLGVVSAVLDPLSLSPQARADILKCIGEKNSHEIVRICDENGVASGDCDRLCALVELYGNPAFVLEKLEALLPNAASNRALDELRALIDFFRGSELLEMLRIDFSVVNDMKYYNGFVFKGFIEGVPHSVLSGGQYDALMQRMHRKSGAVGFAVYLDMIERLADDGEVFDVDCVLLYDANVSASALSGAVEALRSDGKRVSAQRRIPEKLRYQTLLKFEDGEVKRVETHA